MSSMQEMQLLVDKIRKSSTTDEMTDNCIRLIVEYGGWVNIVPTYHNGLIDGYTVFEPGETYKYNNIFNITRTESSGYTGSRGLCRSYTANMDLKWKYKDFFLGTSAQSGAYMVSQLDAMDEKMGNHRGIHYINPGFCFYETFNKMDMLFRFCGDRVKGLSFDKRAEIDPKQTSWDNLIIELGYPDCTPEYRAEVCTRLIRDYGFCLSFVPVYNPNEMISYAVKVYSNWNRKKQRVFIGCKLNDGGFVIFYSNKNFHIADKNENSEAIPVFGALLDLCKSKAR